MTPRRAGDALLHPVALLSIAVLILNDHVLKPSLPGLVSGKLSGIAVLVLLPLSREFRRFSLTRFRRSRS